MTATLSLLEWRPPATKAEALSQHERLRPKWMEDARRIARELAANGAEVHVRMVRAEMIRRGLHDANDAASESRFGAVFRASDGFVAVGFHHYSDTERNVHSKWVRTWKLKRAESLPYVLPEEVER